MRNLILFFVTVFMLVIVLGTPAKAVWVDWTEDPRFGDVVYQKKYEERIIDGITHQCTTTIAYVWGKIAAGLTETCIAGTIMTIPVPNPDPQPEPELPATCNGCPKININNP